MHDVVIVGARSAGASLALLLARKGLKVAMVDRTRFPSDTMSGHFIHPAGISCLRRWGVLERLAATDTPAQARMSFDFGPVVLSATPTAAADGTSVAYAPRRWIFDPLLAEAAVAAGADLQQGVSVESMILAGDRVAGIKGRNRDGQRVDLPARLVVGADGKRSRIAAALAAESYECRPATACVYYSYWQDFPAPHTHLFSRAGRFIVVAPTNGGLTFIGVLWPVAEFHAVRADLDQRFHAALREIPWIAERLADARRVERYVGTTDTDGFFRKPWGRGWALLGDAGYHRDPITAQGMTDAFQHAELLAESIEEGLGGRQPLDAALARYQARRDESVRPMYDLTCDLARLAPPAPPMAALIEAIQQDPVAQSDFFGVIAGTVPVQAFFAPENMARLTGRRSAA